jgi:hypothetical protein
MDPLAGAHRLHPSNEESVQPLTETKYMAMWSGELLFEDTYSHTRLTLRQNPIV